MGCIRVSILSKMCLCIFSPATNDDNFVLKFIYRFIYLFIFGHSNANDMLAMFMTI